MVRPTSMLSIGVSDWERQSKSRKRRGLTSVGLGRWPAVSYAGGRGRGPVAQLFTTGGVGEAGSSASRPSSRLSGFLIYRVRCFVRRTWLRHTVGRGTVLQFEFYAGPGFRRNSCGGRVCRVLIGSSPDSCGIAAPLVTTSADICARARVDGIAPARQPSSYLAIFLSAGRQSYAACSRYLGPVETDRQLALQNYWIGSQSP